MTPISALKLRPAAIEDIPSVWALLDDFRGQWADDFTEFDKDDVLSLFQDGHLLVLDRLGFCVGVLWVHDSRGSLWADIKAVVRPSVMKDACRMAKDIIKAAFELFRVDKLKVHTFENTRSAGKLLKRLHFKQLCFFRNDSSKSGKKVDIFVHELKKSYLERVKGNG